MPGWRNRNLQSDPIKDYRRIIVLSSVFSRKIVARKVSFNNKETQDKNKSEDLSSKYAKSSKNQLSAKQAYLAQSRYVPGEKILR